MAKLTGESWIELFLDENKQSLNAATEGEPHLICNYRLRADGSVEFFKDSEEGPVTLSTDTACRMALYDFMLNPFPVVFRNGDQIFNEA